MMFCVAVTIWVTIWVGSICFAQFCTCVFAITEKDSCVDCILYTMSLLGVRPRFFDVIFYCWWEKATSSSYHVLPSCSPAKPCLPGGAEHVS